MTSNNSIDKKVWEEVYVQKQVVTIKKKTPVNPNNTQNITFKNPIITDTEKYS